MTDIEPAQRRLAVIGPPGSGKSTTAELLAGRLQVAHIELDALFHGPGWSEPTTQEFRQTVMEALGAAEADHRGWAVAGNYVMVADLVQGRADTIVWLDLDRRHTMPRIVRRTLRRAARREELWNGNRERWRDVVHPRNSMIVQAWKAQPKHRARYEELADTPLWANAQVHRVRSPGDVDALVEQLAPG